MFYAFSITVPPNTPEASRIRVNCPIAHGVIHRVELEFEKWCANLLHIQIFRFEHMIYPSGPGQSFASDGDMISFSDYFEVFEEPYTLHLEAWNVDDFFDWTCRVRVGVIPRFVAEHMYGRPRRTDIRRLRESFGLPPEGI